MDRYFCMKQPPFATVYIQGTVRDLTGKKMSKSLGNIIDPLEIIAQYGTDALRYTLVTATAIGQDVFLSEERFVAGRNFANKLWNATRFVLSQLQQGSGQWSVVSEKIKHPTSHSPLTTKHLSVADRWILSRLQRTIDRVTASLDKCLFNEAASMIYGFLWHDFCDWYVEVSKVQVNQGQRDTTVAILRHVLETSLRLLHPVMPFVTEELWQHVQEGASNASIMTAPWPKSAKTLADREAEARFAQLQAVISAIRTTRAELNVPLTSKPPVRLAAKEASTRSFFEEQRPLLQTIAGVSDVTVSAKSERQKDAASAIVDGIEVVVPLAGLIDTAKETQRLQQRVAELTNYLAKTDARLSDPHFTKKAPADVVEQTKAQRAQTQETLKKLSEYLTVLQSM
ncbi:MAG: class I tRNA ligase family protein [Candidatus Omnitrophica bacterium]|nr:class I tRNA ligase family protein [Candidatus Omnitrophota bacterium]